MPKIPCKQWLDSKYHSPAGSLVQDALRHLKLGFEQDATLGDYQPDAVLKQLSDNTALVLVATNPEDYFANGTHISLR